MEPLYVSMDEVSTHFHVGGFFQDPFADSFQATHTEMLSFLSRQPLNTFQQEQLTKYRSLQLHHRLIAGHMLLGMYALSFPNSLVSIIVHREYRMFQL
jgi:hypothetical protein